MTNDLEIRHCRALVAVSEHRGISAAARALGLAQSTVSEALLSLERLIGATVTVRRPGQEAALTATALALLPHARALIAASEAALAVVRPGDQRAIRLGAVESASTFLLPRAVAAFRTHWPNVAVHVTIGLCEDLRGRVQRGELDAAITVEGADRAPARDEPWSRVLTPARLCLFASAGSVRPGHRVTQRELARRPLLLPDPDGAFNVLLRAWFAKAVAQPRLESAGSIDGVKIGVRSGGFIGVLPTYAIDRELAQGEFLDVGVHEPLPSIALGLTTRRPPTPLSPLGDMVRCIEAAIPPPAGSRRATPGGRRPAR